MNAKKTLTTALLLVGAILTGCQPKEAVDETEHKNHQDTHRLVVVLTPGQMQGSKFIANGNSPVSFEASQEGKWEQDKIPTVNPFVTYFVEVKHYSKSGVLINREYATNGEDRIHQHFFIPQLPEGDNPLDVINYQYLDTDPWDAPISTDAKVIGDKNPIGLKGAITFKQSDSKLTIRLMLLHARKSKFNSKGEASPFYRRGIWTANDQQDIDIKFTIKVSPVTNNSSVTNKSL